MKIVEGVDFAKYALSAIIQYVQWTRIGEAKCSKVIKKYFFIIKLLHAHLQYVCYIPAKYSKDTLTALRGVDFTKYALSAIISKCAVVENWLS